MAAAHLRLLVQLGDVSQGNGLFLPSRLLILELAGDDGIGWLICGAERDLVLREVVSELHRTLMTILRELDHAIFLRYTYLALPIGFSLLTLTCYRQFLFLIVVRCEFQIGRFGTLRWHEDDIWLWNVGLVCRLRGSCKL